MTREVCACHYYPLELCPGEEAVKIIDAKQATPREQLIQELLDSRIPKTEREHCAASEIERLRAEVTKRHEANRWNVYPDGDALRVCLGGHEKHEDCTFVRYVPESEVTKLRADVAELESNLSASAESEKYLADRVDTLTHCILVEIAALGHNQRGSTHWEGCESRHHDCAAIKRMEAAIDQAMRSA